MQLQCQFPDSSHFLHTQVLHNMALCEAHLGHWDKAQVHLVSALDYKTEAKLTLIDRALQSTLVSQKHCRRPPPSSLQMIDGSDTTIPPHRFHILSCWPVLTWIRPFFSHQKRKFFQPAVVQSKALFRPNKNYVAELQKRDYLGKSKVSISRNNVNVWQDVE